MMRVLVVGSGAVGSFYGALLQKSGAEVSLVCRSDYEIVKERGIEISSPLGNWHFTPTAVYRRTEEIPSPPDYLFVCTKVLPEIDRVALIRGAVGPQTAIVLLQNGVEIEAEVAQAFPENLLISGLAFVCVSRLRYGHIWHQAYGNLMFGRYPEGIPPEVTRLCEPFRQVGIKAKAVQDIIAARWQKNLWNAAFNPTSVLSGGLTTQELLSQEPVLRKIMEEVYRIASALGHPPPPDAISKSLESTRRMPPYKTSMLLDFEAGRPMEIEAILGNAVRAAGRVGVEVPRLETLYALMKLLERKRSDGNALL